MWDLPGPGLEPVSPALAGGFLTAAPPGKPHWPIFKIGLFVFLLLSLKGSLYILDNSPLSNVSFANIFSQSVAFLLILLTLFLKAEVFNFNEVLLISSFFHESFMLHVFGVVSKRHHYTEDFLQCYLLKVI